MSQASERSAQYYLESAATRGRDAWTWFEAEWPQIQYHWELLGKVGTFERPRLNYALFFCFLLGRRGVWHTVIEWAQEGVQAARKTNERAIEMVMLDYMATGYASLRRWQFALEFYKQSLALAQNLQDHVAEAEILLGMGRAYRELGWVQEAMQHLQRSVALAVEIGNPSTEMAAQCAIGIAFLKGRGVDRASSIFEEYLKWAEAYGDQDSQMRALGNLGTIQFDLGNLIKALQLYEQTLTLARELDDQPAEATTLANIASVYASARFGEKERAYTEPAREFARLADIQAGDVLARTQFGSTRAVAPQRSATIQYYERVLTSTQEMEYRGQVAMAYANRGDRYIKREDWQTAIASYEQALKIARDISNELLQSRIMNSLEVAKQRLQTQQEHK